MTEQTNQERISADLRTHKGAMSSISAPVNTIAFKVKFGDGSELVGHYNNFDVHSNRMRGSHAKYKVVMSSKEIVLNDRMSSIVLDSSDYLDAKNYPNIIFESNDFVRDRSGALTLFGFMTLRDIKHEIALQISSVDLVIDNEKRVFERIAFRTWIDRRNWGIHIYNELAESSADVSHQVLIEGYFHRRTLTSN